MKLLPLGQDLTRLFNVSLKPVNLLELFPESLVQPRALNHETYHMERLDSISYVTLVLFIFFRTLPCGMRCSGRGEKEEKRGAVWVVKECIMQGAVSTSWAFRMNNHTAPLVIG